MTSDLAPRSEDVVRLELDLGSYELGAEECRELVRLLRQRSELPDGVPAGAGADRLEALVFGSAGVAPAGTMTEEELDAVAEAAWAWCQDVGTEALPERVLRILDLLRARHTHE
jgi:hypothetical protein